MPPPAHPPDRSFVVAAKSQPYFGWRGQGERGDRLVPDILAIHRRADAGHTGLSDKNLFSCQR
ncbi:hypothetical protein B5C34_13010 [Pacificimonas flava]|uniref:Uncharacterized protein n=1 Tax=Pacificimonas flava TaxID=1234595 RepID=A0A219B840_9SPHN|nr:hypothetical protein B5C34_13010 [Pacificimonas flava]